MAQITASQPQHIGASSSRSLPKLHSNLPGLIRFTTSHTGNCLYELIQHRQSDREMRERLEELTSKLRADAQVRQHQPLQRLAGSSLPPPFAPLAAVC